MKSEEKMVMYKICQKISFGSKEWLEYILWRNFNFQSFESLDSTLRKSFFLPKTEDDWKYALTIGKIMTDVVTDLKKKKKYCQLHSGDEIAVFSFLEDEREGCIGYDILDGELNYSLLTNFGNDDKIVNACLSRNALIRHKFQVLQVHEWWISTMGNDPHVQGSKIVAVYESIDMTGH